MLEVLYHHAKFGGPRFSPAAGVSKNVEFFVCLSVCLFVRHAFERQSLFARFRHEGVGNVSGIMYLDHPLICTENFTENVPGNPSAGGVTGKHKRGSQV